MPLPSPTLTARALSMLALSAGLLASASARAQQKAPAGGGNEDSEYLRKAREQVKGMGEDELFRTARDDDAAADEDGTSAEQQQREAEKPINQMSRAELLKAGFVFGTPEHKSQRSSGLLMALVPGAVVHGAGHLYLGDKRTGLGLLIMEATGLALVGGGALVPLIFEGDAASMSGSRSIIYLGTGMFAMSYLLDILGTLQGPELQFSENSRRLVGGSMAASYTFLSTDSFPLRNLLSVEATAQTAQVFFKAGTRQDVSLDTSFYDATFGWRFWRGEEAQTFAWAQVDGELMNFRGLGRFNRLSGAGLFGLSMDLGALSSHLRGLALGGSTGFMYQRYALPDATQDPTADDYTYSWEVGSSSIPLELFLHFNFSERLRLRFAYTRRDGALLQDIDRLFAVPSLAATYASTKTSDIEVKAEYGEGLGLSIGLRFWVW